MKKKALVILLVMLLTTTVGAVAYSFLISLQGQVSVLGFDVVGYSPESVDNYLNLVSAIELTHYIDPVYGDLYCSGFTSPDSNTPITGVVIDLTDGFPETASANVTMYLGSWRNIDEVGVLYLWEIDTYDLGTLIPITHDNIKYRDWSLCWLGDPDPLPAPPEGVNTIIFSFNIDLGESWGDIDFTATFEYVDGSS